MSKKSLSSFSSFIQDFTFTRGDVELILKIDVDAMTDSYFREVGKLRVAFIKERAQSTPSAPNLLLENAIKEAAEENDADVETDEEAAAKNAQEVQESVIDGIGQIWEQSALTVADKREMRITQLLCGEEPHEGSLLRGWDATDDEGNPVDLNASALRNLSPNAVEAIWEFCVEKANGEVKKN